MQQEAAELIQTAVNVADGVCQRHCSLLTPFVFQWWR
jgi:hypothetical protein